MIRFLATTALLGVLLAAPAWAETMTNKAHHHHARHAIHHAASTAGDDSAESLNSQVLQDLNARR